MTVGNVIAILIIIALVGGGYYLYRRKLGPFADDHKGGGTGGGTGPGPDKS